MKLGSAFSAIALAMAFVLGVPILIGLASLVFTLAGLVIAFCGWG